MNHSIPFVKMHGLGNDFIVMDTIKRPLEIASLPIKRMADRHFGIGCDQILIISKAKHADFFCLILNSDGSEAEQCGNGLRCVARYIHEEKLHSSRQFTIETVAGVFPIDIKDYEHIQVTLPLPDLSAQTLHIPIPELNMEVSGNSLSIGNPHFIISVDNLKYYQTKQVGAALSTHSVFPKGTNVGFVQKLNPGHIVLRTYERGAGETYACGSNACAAVASGILQGELQNSVNVDFQYGQLKIEWQGQGKPVQMTGPAAKVFSGLFG